MDIGSLLIFAALLLLVGLFVGRPLLEDRSVALTQTEHEYSSLLAERDRVLDSIRELDMDYSMGKISTEDYGDQRGILIQHGAEILRQLDEFAPEGGQSGSGTSLEDRFPPLPEMPDTEPREPASMPEFDYDLENLVSARRQSKSGKAAGFCHQCGNPIQQQDRFCSRCGATI